MLPEQGIRHHKQDLLMSKMSASLSDYGLRLLKLLKHAIMYWPQTKRLKLKTCKEMRQLEERKMELNGTLGSSDLFMEALAAQMKARKIWIGS